MTGWSGSEDGDSNAYTLWLKNITKKRRHGFHQKKKRRNNNKTIYIFIYMITINYNIFNEYTLVHIIVYSQ